MSDSLFERVGGESIFKKINSLFYDKIYADPWIGKYFEGIPQKHIEDQQTDFLIAAFGGPDKYYGRMVPEAHKHMHVSEELFALREKLLMEAMVEAGAPQELVERWKKIDHAFKNSIIKTKEQCEPRYATDQILSFADPFAMKRAG